MAEEPEEDFDAPTELSSLLRLVQTVKETFGEPMAQPPQDLLEASWEILRHEFKSLRDHQQKRTGRRRA